MYYSMYCLYHSVHHMEHPGSTNEDPQFPGVHFIGQPRIKEVTSDGGEIYWKDAGIAFSIPPGAVPEGESLKLSVRSCLTGPFQPPDGCKFTSPAFVISPEFNFVNDIQLEIHHFAKLRNDRDCNNMSFVSSPCRPQYSGSQPHYQFKPLRGGAFLPGQPFGKISLRHFCILSTVSQGKAVLLIAFNTLQYSYFFVLCHADADVSFVYSARLYRDSLPPGPCTRAVFTMTLGQPDYCEVKVNMQAVFTCIHVHNHCILPTLSTWTVS